MNQTYDFICVIPVYNEADILPTAIATLVQALNAQSPTRNYQIIIANNGSTDRTAEVATGLEKQYGSKLKHSLVPTKGRGHAFRHVFSNFTNARSFLYIDVDLPCELGDLPKLLEQINQGADLAISRRRGKRPLKRRVMTQGLRTMNRLLFNVKASDSQCAVKALSPAAVKVMLEDCQQTGWFLDTELVVMSKRRGLVIKEVPINWIEQRFRRRKSKVSAMKDSIDCLKSLRQIKRRSRQVPSLRRSAL